MVLIKHTRSGNCPCMNCGKLQEGLKLHPYTVWHKNPNENRGHNDPVCSLKCAQELSRRF